MANGNGSVNAAARVSDWFFPLFSTARMQLERSLCFFAVFMGIVLPFELRFEMSSAQVCMAALEEVDKNISNAATLDIAACLRQVSDTSEEFKARTIFISDFCSNDVRIIVNVFNFNGVRIFLIVNS